MSDDRKPRLGEKKWGREIIEAGWTQVPNVFFERMRALGLDALDLVIIIVITSHWWEEENRPHPSKTTIARMIGVDARTIQRRLAALEHAGLIKRQQRRDSPRGSKTNIYHFDGLRNAATPFAIEAIKERAIKRAADAQRFNRKKPVKLTVV